MGSQLTVKKQNGCVESSTDSPAFLEFLEMLGEIVEYESGSLFLLERRTQRLRRVASRGEGIDFISSVQFPLGQGLSAWVAQKRKMIYLADIHRGSRHGQRPVRSYLSIPLELNDKIIGVLNLGHVVPDAFGGGKLEVIQARCKELTRALYHQTYLSVDEKENSAY